VKCVIDNFTYRINNNLGTLQFINSANTTTVSISQKGDLGIQGGNDLVFKAGGVHPADPGDIIFSDYGEGEKAYKARIWSENGTPRKLHLGVYSTDSNNITLNNVLTIYKGGISVEGSVFNSNGFVVSDGTDTFVSLGNDNNRNLELRSKGGTPYIDFSNDTEKKNNNYTTDFDMRIILTDNDTLEVQGGNLKVEGKVSSGSDIALKKDIQKLDDNMIGKVMQLNPVTYRWKNDSEKDNINYGLIAQEVEKIFPDMVSGEEGSKSISYDSLIPVLIKAVQEQQQEIEQLKSEIQSLKQK